MCMNNRDQVLVEELKNGKEKTLKIFYEEYFALFVSFANSLLPSEEECKDVVHDVFLKYWDCKEDFNNLIAIRAFFYKSIRINKYIKNTSLKTCNTSKATTSCTKRS